MKKILSTALLTLAAMIWGFAFVAQKAADSVPAFTLGAARSFLATVFLVFVILAFDKMNGQRRLFSKGRIDINKTELVGGALCGIILALASFFQQTGINMDMDPGKAGFITALYVVLVPIYALALKKRARINVWISVVIAAFGFYFLCIKGDFSIVTSDIFVIIAALIFPLHILTIDYFSPRCDGIRMSCIQFLAAGIFNLVCAIVFEYPLALDSVWDAMLPVLFLGIGSSGIAYTLQIVGQKGTNPAAASLILSLESVFAALGSALLLKVTMQPREYLGCIIVFFAVILSQIDFKKIK
jgi:drug/metabolite transporter (DMT)-like permease